LGKDITKLERQIDSFLDKIADASSDHVARAYERKIAKLETEKMMAEQKLAQAGTMGKGKPEKIELALKFLTNPWKLWTSNVMEHRRLVLKLAFAERLPYTRNEGYRTPKNHLALQGVRGVSEVDL
jgi:hypothetical protein